MVGMKNFDQNYINLTLENNIPKEILSNINTFYVLLSIIIIQLIESNIISPYLHSKRSETHPLLVLISLSLFGSLFGVLGMLFAVPLFKFFEITLKHYPLKLNKN